jgi:hypothetical protein
MDMSRRELILKALGATAAVPFLASVAAAEDVVDNVIVKDLNALLQETARTARNGLPANSMSLAYYPQAAEARGHPDKPWGFTAFEGGDYSWGPTPTEAILRWREANKYHGMIYYDPDAPVAAHGG